MAYPHQEIPGVPPPGIQLPRCLFFSSPSLTAEIEDEPCKEKYVHFFVTPLNTNWNEYFCYYFLPLCVSIHLGHRNEIGRAKIIAAILSEITKN